MACKHDICWRFEIGYAPTRFEYGFNLIRHLAKSLLFHSALNQFSEYFTLLVLQGNIHDGGADLLGTINDLLNARNALCHLRAKCSMLKSHMTKQCARRKSNIQFTVLT